MGKDKRFDLESPFWKFSLIVYGDEHVRKACLELQEGFGVDVNLALFAGYVTFVENLTLSHSAAVKLQGELKEWHEKIVYPMRQVRIILKDLLDSRIPHHEHIQRFRMSVKEIELQSEKLEQGMIWQWLDRERSGLVCLTDVNVRSSMESVLGLYDAIDRAGPFIDILRASYFGRA